MSRELAIAGLGYWGPNLLRAFNNSPDCNIRWCCDLNKESLTEVRRRYPNIQTTVDFEEIVSDTAVEAIILAVPTKNHFILAQKALKAGKDVLLEKPMAQTAKEAWDLVHLAEKNKRILMVDHILLFNPAVQKIKKLIDKKEIGNVIYIDCARTNLGLFRKDINVIFDLASHDFAVIQYLLGTKPKSLSVTGKSHADHQIDVAYLTAEYPGDILAHIHVTWLSPLKVRRMLIVGDKKMIVFDDNEPSEKVKIYDKGITRDKQSGGEKSAEIGYRFGDVLSPHIETSDSLANLAQSFIEAISTRRVAKSGGEAGAEIVEILENATKVFNRSS